MQRPPTLPALVCLGALALSACSDGGGGANGSGKDGKAPTTPSGVTAQAGSATSVHVMWRPSADDKAVTGYEVFQKGEKVSTLPGAKTMVDIDGLKPRTAYSFTVRARDAAENSSADSTAVELTTPSSSGKGPSTAPTGLMAVARKGSIELSWKPPQADGAIESHELYLDGRPTTTIVWGAMPTGDRAVYTLTVTDPPGTRYRVKLRAKLPDGKWGDFSAERTVVVR
ncbi:fibronectin type III domain-containing protein [Streptomyces clavuligerus]|uniref:fibronectin type III domain-containing protein n=1 Tax=Streptomyces clavuligerus TaxID=1901 RepID=UPI0027DB912C|nr:fibronectin type III domain-containing protein [Streptomyces clavuligerus]